MIASICHGAWVLISAKIVESRKLTGVIAMKDDIEFAGEHFIDEEVVVDGNFVSSHDPTGYLRMGSGDCTVPSIDISNHDSLCTMNASPWSTKFGRCNALLPSCFRMCKASPPVKTILGR